MNGFLFLVALALLAALGISLAADDGIIEDIFFVWFASIVLISTMAAAIGRANVGKIWGVAIDSRKRYSLSRAQMLFWTILVLSTVYTFFLWNIHSVCPADKMCGGALAFRFEIPTILWALMGISSISLVGSPLILRAKEKDDVDENADVSNARLTDLFLGEVHDDKGTVDLARVQMLLITIVVGISYAILVGGVLLEAGEGHKWIVGFPAFDEGIIALLAISHAGYLVHKAVPKKK